MVCLFELSNFQKNTVAFNLINLIREPRWGLPDTVELQIYINMTAIEMLIGANS